MALYAVLCKLCRYEIYAIQIILCFPYFGIYFCTLSRLLCVYVLFTYFIFETPTVCTFLIIFCLVQSETLCTFLTLPTVSEFQSRVRNAVFFTVIFGNMCFDYWHINYLAMHQCPPDVHMLTSVYCSFLYTVILL